MRGRRGRAWRGRDQLSSCIALNSRVRVSARYRRHIRYCSIFHCVGFRQVRGCGVACAVASSSPLLSPPPPLPCLYAHLSCSLRCVRGGVSQLPGRSLHTHRHAPYSIRALPLDGIATSLLPSRPPFYPQRLHTRTHARTPYTGPRASQKYVPPFSLSAYVCARVT